MRVLYDISVIARSVAHKRHPTGVFRVVDSVARQLARSAECHLAFCTDGFPAYAQAYVSSDPSLAHVPVRQNTRRSAVSLLYDAVDREIATAHAWRGTLLRPWRKILSETARGLQIDSRILDEAALMSEDIFHATGFSLFPQMKRATHLKRVRTIYDMVPVLFPQFAETPGLSVSFAAVLHEIEHDGWVVSISQSTKDELCGYTGIDPTRVFVTPLAADPHLFHIGVNSTLIADMRRRYSIPDGPYFLSLSTLEVRKNIDHVIRCFIRLVQEQKLTDLSLVLAGPKGWAAERIFAEIESARLLRERIIITGFVDNADLAPLYSGARGFVFPSLYEGFGLPPLEAMQCGTPVITSNTSSLPEVVGDAGILLDPRDSDSLCQSLLDLYDHDDLCRSLSRKSLERAKQFSWERCAQETLRAYRVALTA
jgi:glycosyltransferase involved in cell wall biosynthesis